MKKFENLKDFTVNVFNHQANGYLTKGEAIGTIVRDFLDLPLYENSFNYGDVVYDVIAFSQDIPSSATLISSTELNSEDTYAIMEAEQILELLQHGSITIQHRDKVWFDDIKEVE